MTNPSAETIWNWHTRDRQDLLIEIRGTRIARSPDSEPGLLIYVMVDRVAGAYFKGVSRVRRLARRKAGPFRILNALPAQVKASAKSRN